ncbi:MAG: sulfotransferase domain-containing protein [Phycisphaeraceae bacterium]|nr:sulfotransferase domain-containing protein [Phycisphaeraceae bacterium]
MSRPANPSRGNALVATAKAVLPRPVKDALRPVVRPWLAAPADPWACADAAAGNEWTFRDGEREFKCFFLCGGWKSGTHWVEALLNLHPRAHTIGEFHFESVVDGFSIFLGKPGRVGHHSQKLKRIARRSLYRLVRQCMYAQTKPHLDANPRVMWIGDRSPRRLDTVIPGAPHILLLRDGRDVLVSRAYHVLRANRPEVMLRPAFAEMIRRWGPEFATNPERFVDPDIGALGSDEWVRFTCRGWGEALKNDLATIPRLRAEGTPVHLVRYEDLHRDLETHRAELYRFLGLDPSEAAAPSHETKTLPGFKRVDLKAATRKGQTGDWQNHFNDRVKRIFKQVAGEALIQAGYEKDLNW